MNTRDLTDIIMSVSNEFEKEGDNVGTYARFAKAVVERDPTSCDTIAMPDMPFWNNAEKTPEQLAHIKDRANTLQAGINLPFDEKLDMTERIIKRSIDNKQTWAVSYSGGGDSTVLSHIMVEHMGIKNIPHVFSNTRMEYPETLVMIRKWYDRLRAQGVDCQTAYPKKRPNTLWKEIGVPLWSKEIAYKYRKFLHSPTDNIPKQVPKYLHEDFRKAKSLGLKITDKCCAELKKKPMALWDKTQGVTGHFTGVRCSEARNRRLAWITKGALYYASTHKLWMSNPLAFWTKEDVDMWLGDHDIEILRPDTPTGGSGCVTCMFGCQSRAAEGAKNNMQDLKERNPKMWKAALDDWGYRDVLDKMNIPYD